MDCWPKHLPKESKKIYILVYTGKPHCHLSNDINVKIKSRDLCTRQELLIMHHMFSWNMVSSSVDVPPTTVLCVNRNYFSTSSKYNIVKIKVKPSETLMRFIGIYTVMTSTTEASVLTSGSVPCIFFPDWYTSLFSFWLQIWGFMWSFTAMKVTLCFPSFLSLSVCCCLATFHI